MLNWLLRRETLTYFVSALAEMPTKRMSVQGTMLPDLLYLPFSDFAYFVKIGVKPIPSICIGIDCDTPPLSLQVVIQVIPQAQNLFCGRKVWYGLMRASPFGRLDAFASSNPLE